MFSEDVLTGLILRGCLDALAVLNPSLQQSSAPPSVPGSSLQSSHASPQKTNVTVKGFLDFAVLGSPVLIGSL